MNWKVSVLNLLLLGWEKLLMLCESQIETKEERELFDQRVRELKTYKERVGAMAKKQSEGE